MPLTFDWEPLAALLDEGIEELVLRHWQEIALDKDEVPLDPDYEKRFCMELQGTWKAFVARRDGRIIGYISFFFHESHHNYKGTRYIFDDVFWLAPEERKGLTGYLLLKHAFTALPRPSKLQIKVKLSFEQARVGKLLERLKLKPIEKVYSRMLK